MVALHLSNSKKILSRASLFIILLIGLVSYSAKNYECKPIKDYILLEASLSADTLLYNDSLILKIEFKNKSDSVVQFYPKALLYLANPAGSFEFDAYYLNDTMNLKYSINLKPQESYQTEYKILIKDPFFKKEDNTFALVYVVRELKGTKKRLIKLCGFLQKSNLHLFVK